MLIDSALLIDSFKLLTNKKAILLWLLIKEQAKLKGEFTEIKLSINSLKNKLKIGKEKCIELLSELHDNGLIYYLGDDRYYIINERNLFDQLRSEKKESYYTKCAAIELPKDYIKKYKNVPINAMRIYWLLFIKVNMHIDSKEEKSSRLRKNEIYMILKEEFSKDKIEKYLKDLKNFRLGYFTPKGDFIIKGIR